MTRPVLSIEKSSTEWIPGVRPPHCDQRILHLPSECSICSEATELQNERARLGVSNTGYQNREWPCPANVARSDESLASWRGNRPHLDDAFTLVARLCDDDGIVRAGRSHAGTDFQCTGHAHYEGEHIKCSTPIHASPKVVIINPEPPKLDIEDFDALAPELDQLVGAWIDRGVSPQKIWALLASAVLSTAKLNDVPWEKVVETLKDSWENG